MPKFAGQSRNQAYGELPYAKEMSNPTMNLKESSDNLNEKVTTKGNKRQKNIELGMIIWLSSLLYLWIGDDGLR